MCKRWELFTSQLNRHSPTQSHARSLGLKAKLEEANRWGGNIQKTSSLLIWYGQAQEGSEFTIDPLPVTRVASCCRSVIRACRLNALLTVTCGLILLHEGRHADKPASVCLLRKVLESRPRCQLQGFFFNSRKAGASCCRVEKSRSSTSLACFRSPPLPPPPSSHYIS